VIIQRVKAWDSLDKEKEATLARGGRQSRLQKGDSVSKGGGSKAMRQHLNGRGGKEESRRAGPTKDLRPSLLWEKKPIRIQGKLT